MQATPAAAWQPTLADITAAARRVAPFVERTPLVRLRTLERDGRRVFLKLENLQRTGAFKVRGGFNALSQLPAEARARGVVTHSSGNHAQALALAARDLGLAEGGEPYACTVCMPARANPLKVQRTKALGADVVLVPGDVVALVKHARQLAGERGQAVIPSFDHRDVITGQATVGLELYEQWQAVADGRRLGCVAGPVGGGGLMSGVASALRALGYDSVIAGVEPETAQDTLLSVRRGERVRFDPTSTLCDGLLSVMPGELTFPIVRAHVDVLTVTDAQVMQTARWLLEEARLLVEPSGSVAVAAWRNGALDPTGDVVLIVSGGNVDPGLIMTWG